MGSLLSPTLLRCITVVLVLELMCDVFGCSVKLAQGQVRKTKTFEFSAARLGQTMWVCVCPFLSLSLTVCFSLCVFSSCAFYSNDKSIFYWFLKFIHIIYISICLFLVYAFVLHTFFFFVNQCAVNRILSLYF